MKCKPTFLLYGTQVQQVKPENPIKKLHTRFSNEELKENPIIEKVLRPGKKVYFTIISKEQKPKFTNLDNSMDDAQQKRIIRINEFKEMFYNYIQEEKEKLGNFIEIQKENDKFSLNYYKILKDNNKFGTGTYLDHQYLIDIANRYHGRGIKVPKISIDKNVFSANPLILSGIDLEHYFLYSLGDKEKSSLFLNKIDKMTDKKISGFNYSDQEMKEYEALVKNEKPKGYIPPNILIPQLQDDVQKLQNACDNANDLKKYFDDLQQKSHTQKNKNKIGNNRSFSNIFSDILKKNKNNHLNNKIVLKKNLSFLMNNRNTSTSTRANVSNRIPSEKSGKIMSYRNISKSDISSTISHEKPKLIKKIPNISPFSCKNKNKSIKNSLFDESPINKNSKDIFDLSRFFDKKEEKKLNTLYKSILNNNSGNNSLKNIFNLKKNKKIIKKNLTSLKSISFSKYSKETNKNDISKEDKEQESEYDDIKILKNELDKNNNNEMYICTQEGSKENIEDISSNKIINTNNNLILNKIEENKNHENEKNNSVPIILNENEIKYRETEKMFDSVAEDMLLKSKNKNLICDYLQSRGYKAFEKYKCKDAYLNINRMKVKAIERNFLLEEFKIRNGENLKKTSLSNQQKSIIKVNDLYDKEILNNEYELKKILCERNVEKENIDF